MLTLRVMLRANTDRLILLAAACVLGTLLGVGVIYLALIFGNDRIVDF